MKKQYQHQGFTLVEILIAVVILSIGLLGIAGIQLKGIRSNFSSALRSQATLLANDIAERMHANPGGATNPQLSGVNTNYSKIDSNFLDCDSATPPAPYCSNTSSTTGTSCNTAQIATFDAYTWICGSNATDGITNLLPQGKASISCTDGDVTDVDECTPGSTLTITMQWQEISSDKADETPLTQTLVLSTVP